VLSPVDGIIAHINTKLIEDPTIMNQSPYEEGWLFIVEPTKLRKNLKGLYYGEEARKFIDEEREKLFSLANQDLKVAADGGLSVDEIAKELKEVKWGKFVRTFLRT
jgi:hypothetical protein